MQKNILLLFTDQQRYDTIEALGNSLIKTPALNNLVKRGTAFTRAYTPCPVCIPARYCLHTGQLPHRTGCAINEVMPDNRKSFMELLTQKGYQTHGVGKMHFTFPNQGADVGWGFQNRDFSEEGGGYDDFSRFLEENGYDHVKDRQGVRSEMYYIPQPSQLPQRLHHSTWVADRSIDFLERRDRDRPFMLMTSFIKPHPPFESPTPWNKLYRGPEMPLPKRPEDSENLTAFWSRFQNRYKYRDQGTDNNLIRTMKAAYYSAISFVDYNIGRLLQYMEQNGLMDNTLIVFTSDHGEMMGDYNCFGKRCFLDSAARVPMLMVHPEMAAGRTCSKPVSLVDVLPTFLQYAGIESQEDYSGESLADIVSGVVERDTAFGQYHRNEYGMYMAVTEQFKYIYSAPDNREWLFDLKADPQETRNRAYNPMYVHHREEMKKRVIELLRQDGYTTPLEGEDWKRYPAQQLPEDPDACLLFQDPPDSLPHIPGYERESQVTTEGLFHVGF